MGEGKWPHNINSYFLKRSTNGRIGNGERGMVIGPLGSLLTLFTRFTELCCLFSDTRPEEILLDFELGSISSCMSRNWGRASQLQYF